MKKKSKPKIKTGILPQDEIIKNLMQVFKVAENVGYPYGTNQEKTNLMIINTVHDNELNKYFVLGWYPSKTKSIKDLVVFEVTKDAELIAISKADQLLYKEEMLPDSKEVISAIKTIMTKIFDVENTRENMILN